MLTPAHRLTRLVPGIVLAACALAVPLLAGCSGKSATEITADGKALMAKNDLPGAMLQFRSALQASPNSAEARLLFGKALLDSGDPVAALLELRKAQELQADDDQVVPAIARALVMTGEQARLIAQFGDVQLKDAVAAADLASSLATAHMLLGELDKANQSVNGALQRVPGHVPATVLGARLKAVRGDFDGALAMLGQALAKQADDERGGILQGDVLWHGKNDQAGALESYQRVLVAHPKAVGAHAAVITLLTGQGKFDAAKLQFDLLKKAAPNHIDTLFFEAQFAFTNKNYKTTREITDRLLVGMPNHPLVLELAGAAAYQLKRHTEAEALLARALKSAPRLLLPRHLLAQIYLRDNQSVKAINVLRPVVEGRNPDGNSLALAGEAWLQMGDNKRSDAAFALAAKVAPKDADVRTTAATAQLARGHSAGALEQLQAIAAEDKGYRADVALISARLRQNDPRGALKAIDALERKVPDRPFPYNLRGRVLLLMGDLAGATKAFETAMSKDAKSFPAVASLAAIDLDAGKPDAARKRFEDLIRVDPKSFQAQLALAELGVRTGAPPDEVVKLLRSAVQANPEEPMPHLVLIGQLLASDPHAALQAARDATAALPNDLDIMDAVGRAQLAADSAAVAASTYTKLAALQPANPLHQVRLAEALLASKDLDGARRALRKALEIKPDFVPARRAQLSIALAEGRSQDALKLAREMQTQNPKDAIAFALEGDVEASRRNWDAAAAAYRSALGLDKTSNGMVRLHTALRASGKAAEADRLAADWMRYRPKDPAFRYYLGNAALAQKNYAAAEDHYRAVVDMQPRNALALNNLAWLMVKQGQPGAVAVAQRANDVLPGQAPLMDTLALALAADKQWPKAIEVQKAAIAGNPKDASLKLTLARLLLQSGDKRGARAALEDLAKLGADLRDQAEVAALLQSL